jgi:dephospho-CoA kinase
VPDKTPTVFTVVLTGGIASGKTAVSDCFARLGVPVIDTDRIAREVVEPGQLALKQISEGFGSDYLDSEGRLDRRKMREAIFADPAMKSLLEGILHPLIAEKVLARVREVEAPYCLLVIPLYAESKAYKWVNRVLVVDVSEETQLERVMARDQISPEHAQSILDAQSARQQRLSLADDIIDNSGDLNELEQKVKKLHQKYLALR